MKQKKMLRLAGLILSLVAAQVDARVVQLPFSEGFENGFGSSGTWMIGGSGQARTQITTDFSPVSGSHHLIMDSATSEVFSQNWITLNIDLANAKNVKLSFWIKGGGDDPHAPPPAPFANDTPFDGVAISVDGAHWYEVDGLRNLGSLYTKRTVDLDAAIAKYGLSYTDNFKIRFSHYDDYPLPTDGFCLDDISITGDTMGKLSLTLPNLISETDTDSKNKGTIAVSKAPTSDLVVRLISDDPSELTVTNQVIIPKGKTGTTFNFKPINDELLDGTQKVKITASVENYLSVSKSIRVTDSSKATLSLSLPQSVKEGDRKIEGILKVDPTPDRAVLIRLASSSSSRIKSGTVVIPAGQNEVSFALPVVDDHRINGIQQVSIVALESNWVPGKASVFILDNEKKALKIAFPATKRSEFYPQKIRGTVSLTGTTPHNLYIILKSSDPAVVLPSYVTIPMGESSTSFDLNIPIKSTMRSLLITALASGYSDSTAIISKHSKHTAPIPHPQLVDGNLLRNGDFEAGKQGFSSDYTYNPPGQAPFTGAYRVGPDSKKWNGNFTYSVKDHTTGSGKMLMADCKSTTAAVWRQQVHVRAGVEYIFSIWGANLSEVVAPILDVYVEDEMILSAELKAVAWKSFSTTWRAPSSGTITLSIRSRNSAFLGNDFAIDDLVFRPKERQVGILNLQGNRIQNGDFEAGNQGFETTYSLNPLGPLSGDYFVGSDSKKWNGNFRESLKDHTSGSGLMLMGDGKNPATFIWKQKVPVQAGEEYRFSGWISNLNKLANPTLEVSINGKPFGPMKLTQIGWTSFAIQWTAPSTGMAELRIRNLSTTSIGNDFAIDDLDFHPITKTRSNLVVNGDFEMGNTRFSTGYRYRKGIHAPWPSSGEYGIGTKARVWHGGLYPLSDHTTGSGKMWIGNGDFSPNKIWGQSVQVAAGQTYGFKAWAALLYTQNARLGFFVDGQSIGTLKLNKKGWVEFSGTWTAKKSGAVTLSIRNLSGGMLEAYALDDISFTPRSSSAGDSLMLYLPFNGNAKDESGNGLDGNVQGATLAPDRLGRANRAYDFTEKSSIALGNMGGIKTVSMWVKQRSRKEYDTYFGHYDFRLYASIAEHGRLTLGDETAHVTSSVHMDDHVGEWVHIVGICDGTNSKIYFNGKDVTLRSGNLKPVANTAAFLGKMPQGRHYLNGQIDEVQVYNRVLSTAEIQKLSASKQSNHLMAYFPFNGNANDASGKGHNGKVKDATLTADRFGLANSAYHFSGASSINCGNIIHDFDQFTVSAWIKVDRFSHHRYMGPWGQQEFKPSATNCNYQMYVASDANLGCFGTTMKWADGTILDARAKYILPTHHWRLVTQTYDGQKIRLYDNGKLIYSVRSPGHHISNNLDFIIGRTCGYPSGNSFVEAGFIGDIDELRVYNRALSQTEIQTLYSEVAATQAPRNDLVLSLPFNGNANDASGNGYDGVVMGNAQLTADRFGNKNSAYRFDGVDDYIQMPTLPNVPTWEDYTLSVWFLNNGEGTQGNYGQKILDKTDWFHDFSLAVLRDGKMGLKLYEGSGKAIWCDSHNYHDGEWHHAVVTKQGPMASLWIDGVCEGSISNAVQVFSKTTFLIGYSASPDPLQRRFWSGKLDDILIYNRALSTSEIQTLYQGEDDGGLIAYFPLNGNARDESGNLHNGKVVGAKLTTDRFGRPRSAYRFNGRNDFINCGNVMKNLRAFTVSAWINIDRFTHSQHVGPWSQQKFALPQVDGNYHFYTATDTGLGCFGTIMHWKDSMVNTRAKHVVSKNNWHLITQTYDGHKIRQYDNGTLINTTTVNGLVIDNPEDFLIGKVCAYPNNILKTHYFAGAIDDLRVYNRALSKTEIRKLYSETPSKTLPATAPIAFYPFNGTANDLSNHGNDGLVHGATLTTDRFGKEGSAYLFDGANDYINLGNVLSTQRTPFSFSLWMQTENEGYQVLLGKKGLGCWESGEWQLALKSGQVRLIFSDHYGDNVKPAVANQMLHNGQWHQLFGVVDSTGTKLYIDGALAATSPTTLVAQHRGSIQLGARADANSRQFFQGKIDDVRIYDTALSASEIAALCKKMPTTITVPVSSDTYITEHAGYGGKNAPQGTRALYLMHAMEGLHQTYPIVSFDLTPYAGKTIQGSTVDLTLDLRSGWEDLCVTQSVSIRESRADWDEKTATWANFGDIGFNASTHTGTNLVTQNVTYHGKTEPITFKIPAAIVQRWIDDPASNKGLFLISNSSAQCLDLSFWSKETGQSPRLSFKLTDTPAINNSDLIASYPFSGNANDTSGNGHHGIVHGATLTTDRFGKLNQAFRFNGADTFIEIPDSKKLRLAQTDFTLSVWFLETERNPSYHNTLLAKRSGGGDNGWFYSISGQSTYDRVGKLYYQVSGGLDPWLISTRPLSLNQWHHAVLTYNLENQTARIYLDGVFNYEQSNIPPPNPATASSLFIGLDSAQEGYGFRGAIDDIQIFSRILSDIEIQTLYSPASNKSSTDKVADYLFSGNANDTSGNGHHGIVHGATLTADRFGEPNSAYHFDGEFSWISVPDHDQFTLSSMTVLAWIRTTDKSDHRHIISCYGLGTQAEWYNLYIRKNIGGAAWQVDPGGTPTPPYAVGTTDLTDGAWHLVAGVRDTADAQIKIYVDGKLERTVADISTNALNPSVDFMIGGQNGWKDRFFNGDIDDVRIRSRALSANEIKAIYDREANPPKLLLWNTLTDPNTIYHDHGTFTGGSFTNADSRIAYIANYDQEQCVTFPSNAVSANQGTIELWAKCIDFPQNIPNGAAPNLFIFADGQSVYTLNFNHNDGHGNGGLCGRAGANGYCGTGLYGSRSTYTSVLGEDQLTAWHHYALVWNKNGIPGVDDGTKKVAIFLDGKLNSTRWQEDNPRYPNRVDLSLLRNASLNQGRVAFSNLKVWNYAKTDFSDRFKRIPLFGRLNR